MQARKYVPIQMVIRACTGTWLRSVDSRGGWRYVSSVTVHSHSRVRLRPKQEKSFLKPDFGV